MIAPTEDVLTRFWSKFSDYLPDFFAGLLILIIGLILSEILKKLFITLIRFLKINYLLEKMKLMSKKEVNLWEEILAELLKWTVVILFLISTLEVWGLSRATVVLNQFLFYIPNVIVAAIIGFVGLLLANLVSDLVRHSVTTLGASSANSLSIFSKSAILFFTVLVILNQLGVAQDLIRILFTGIVVMLAMAGGLAFGLGGKEIAKELLDQLKQKLLK